VASGAVIATAAACTSQGATSGSRSSPAAVNATSVRKPTNSVRPNSTENATWYSGFSATATSSASATVSPMRRGVSARRNAATRPGGHGAPAGAVAPAGRRAAAGSSGGASGVIEHTA